jgi:hypothetical protein
MPDWHPNWDDVVFDHTKAQSAIDECRLAAGALTNVLDGFGPAHTSLASDASWRGTYRDDYDGERPLVVGEMRDARDALNALANDIETAAGEAAGEQSRREADRARWRAELEREIARENGPR